MHTDTCTHTPAHSQVHMHTNIHTSGCMHGDTNKHTHWHLHTPSSPCPRLWLLVTTKSSSSEWPGHCLILWVSELPLPSKVTQIPRHMLKFISSFKLPFSGTHCLLSKDLLGHRKGINLEWHFCQWKNDTRPLSLSFLETEPLARHFTTEWHTQSSPPHSASHVQGSIHFARGLNQEQAQTGLHSFSDLDWVLKP